VRQFGLRLLPGGLLLAAVSILVLLPAFLGGVRSAVPVAADVVTAAGILLGLRFGNVRAVLFLIVLALADQVVRLSPPGGVAMPAEPARATIGLLVPLNLAVLAWMPDRGVRRSQVKYWMLIIAAQALGGALVLHPKAARAAHVLSPTLFEPVRSLGSASGTLGHLAFAVALVLALARFAVRPRATEAGIVWALVAAFLAFGLGVDRSVATLFLATGGLIVIIALVETSYAMAYGDELTGLPARRALNSLLSTLDVPYAVAMIDIDHFKKFNDTYGHQTGDQLLRKVATTLAQVIRGGRPFRYGGEEFAVVFPGLSTVEASPLLETLREAVAAMSFTVRGADRRRKHRRLSLVPGARGQVRITVSIGAADCTGAGPTPAEVVRAADEALYRAKHAGRNRVVT
jgi:diguanylate cyclase (GGDEF)-like protein